MFRTPPKTLKASLQTVLENAEEYVADVCFDYPSRKIWAHRALLVVRVPESFQTRYFPQLKQADAKLPIHCNISTAIPYSTFLHLLRFWYTADWDTSPTNSIISTFPNLSLTDTSNSSSSSLSTDHCDLEKISPNPNAEIRAEITALEEQLKLNLLPPCQKENDYEQLVYDLQQIRQSSLYSDVAINIFSAPSKKEQLETVQKKTSSSSILTSFRRAPEEPSSPTSTSAHRFILASQSPYFHAMLCTQFREAACSTVHLPADLFSPITLDVILQYFYTDKLVIPPPPAIDKPVTTVQVRINNKKHSLRVLQKVFRAADYLGHFDTICLAVLHEMAAICHEFKCGCADCAVLLPSMLSFADKHVALLPVMRPALVALYTDPVHNLASLWSTKPFSILVGSMTMPRPSRTEMAISSMFQRISAKNDRSLIMEIADQTLANVTKHNAIHVLHSLHLCLSQIRSANPFPTWSLPTLDIINTILHHTVAMISVHFDFYCVEYPILLSCVDGIGFGFSVDFLDFLLKRVLDEGIQISNAAILYQGIVRDLVGRQEIVKNVAVDGVLMDARQRCANYLSHCWAAVKAEGGFDTIEKETMRQLAEDINVPYRTLTKPVESDFSAIFSFKPRTGRLKPKSTDTDNGKKDNGGGRRLSLGGLRTQSRSSQDDGTCLTRVQSLSAERPAARLSLDSHQNLSSYSDIMEPSDRSQGRYAPPISQGSSSSLTDALLPLDLTGNMSGNEPTTPRRSRLKFELPIAPLRPARHQPQLQPRKRGRSPRKYRWSLGNSNTSDGSDEEELATMPVIGTKVELRHRPLPTLGTIKFIGPVAFAKGTWFGIELESRLGNNDGSVDGNRYFQTETQRGVFVKMDDFKVISKPLQK
ncbi:hypothetical protein EC973_005199 [Apophysomyces ossiformis]|uniref:CAP-Gly domain-containing protein n=1 Tax=Apophysomyces ossiformis TaxID=679940 RepID=A0A8H7ET77_9FUNG|nr:hypothetical protein EC973_005199 [Apophysomyces ossiformis]